jgi:replicative DNA helicase
MDEVKEENHESTELDLLSFIWQNQSVLPEAMSMLQEDYFTSPKTKSLFIRLKAAFNEVNGRVNANVVNFPMMDRLTLSEKDFNQNISDPYSNYRVMANRVLNNYKVASTKQILSAGADKVINKEADYITETISDMAQGLSKLNSIGNSSIRQGSIQDDVEERRMMYQDRKLHPEKLNIISSGFKQLDKSIGGFMYGNLIYVIGRKGDGKSVLMLNFGYHFWRRGKNVILFSLEMSKEDYMRRFDSRAAGVPIKGLKMGTLTDAEEKKYNDYLDQIKTKKDRKGNQLGEFYVVDIPGKCTPAMIETKTEEIEQKLGIVFDSVIIDYAQIMQPNIVTDVKRDNLGNIALELKQFARRKMKIVISAAQMTRAGKSETQMKNGRAGTEHVAESDQISDHLDFGFAIRSTSDHDGIIESFKTRDGEPCDLHFIKAFHMMNIVEQEFDAWKKQEDSDS